MAVDAYECSREQFTSVTDAVGKLPNLLWYVIQTCSRHEVKVEADLTRKGVEAFLPRMMVRSRRRDRLQMLETPLFPGYLFVRTDLNDWANYNIIRTLGVVGMRRIS